MAFVSGCIATLAVVGFYMGVTLHGPTAPALLPTFAGAAGGFGIGNAGRDVYRRWRAGRPGRGHAEQRPA